MFHPISNGSVIEINDNAFGFVFKCHIPPIGYGVNSVTGKVEETDILDEAEYEEDNYWIRPQLPKDFYSRRKDEKKIQELDKYYVDPYLEEIRRREWGRRLRGIWFPNYNPKTDKVEYIYITGLHYLYITYWKFQGKYMDFRMPDRDFFYVLSYCMFDPDCLGINELTRRKNGKTARAGCWLYERTSRMNNHHGGIQSKSDDDAQEFFKKAVRDPWKHLPDFFRPVYDIMKGDSPNDELRFFAPSKRGSRAEEESETLEEPLDSFIDFKPAIESAYDGPELHSYVSDESGKVKKPTSIKERQNVVRFCTEIEGFFNGKHYFTTTVESEKDEQENVEFQELTANSNPLERNENNRTVTGLYTYFLPAHKSMNFDKYGFANEEAAEKYIVNTLKAYQDKGDTRGMSSFKRKYPRTIKEAFSTDGEYALYNPELLNNQLDDIQWTHHFTEFGDLEWENGNRISVQKVTATGELIYEPSKVIWKPNPKGKFEKIKDWFPKNPNDVFYQGGHYHPNNNFSYRIGCDPFRYDKTKDKRRSNCAAFVYQLPDPHYPNDIYDDAFVLRYSYREESTRASNEDVLKMAWWCGCKILFERNVNHWKSDFTNWECGGFLKWLPGEVEPGINTAGNAVQAICNYTEAYINKFISKVYFKTLIRKETGWLGFKVEDTEKFDEPMAAGITLIHVREEQARKQHYTKNISEYFSKDSGWTY